MRYAEVWVTQEKWGAGFGLASHVMPQAVSSHVMLQGATVPTQMFLHSNPLSSFVVVITVFYCYFR
jgi:hypothetical protein